MIVSLLIDRWLIRRQLVRLARTVIDGQLPDGWLPALLADYAPELPPETATERFFDLVGAVIVVDRRLDWGGPTGAARSQVRNALDALTGGAL